MPEDDKPIATLSCPQCFVCGSEGRDQYKGLRDRLYGVAGEWDLKRCGNPACGLIWLDPMPATDELSRLYVNYSTHQDRIHEPRRIRDRFARIVEAAYHADRYGYDTGSARAVKVARSLLPFLPVLKAEWDFKVFHLSARPGGRLLDVGCGNGVMLKRMADLGWDVTGVDFDPNAVENARAKGLTVHLGSLDEQAFAPESFDAVVSAHLMEHIPDPAEYLRSCYRLLAPGGRLVSVTPNAASLGHRLFGADWRGLEPPRHLHIFTPGSLESLAKKAGFLEATVSTVVGNSHGVFRASRELRKFGRVSDHKAPLHAKAWYRGMRWGEWIVQHFQPHVGEELLLRATKGDGLKVAA